MTFWLDAQLNPELADWLTAEFNIVVHAFHSLGFADAKDLAIINAAKQAGKIVIITKDHELIEWVERLGTPPQVIWLTVGHITNLELQLVLRQAFLKALAALSHGAPVVEISR